MCEPTACSSRSAEPLGFAGGGLEQAVAAGLDLYEAREYAVAAERFHEAAREAYELRDRETEKTALTAECTSWLRAQRMMEFSTCTERLAKRHRRSNRSDPGLSTLLALGAIAGERPTPPFRVPSEVAPLLREASHGRVY